MKKRRIKRSLFIRIFLFSIIIIVVPMLINLFNTSNTASTALEEESLTALSRVAQEKKNELDLLFDAQFALSNAWTNELFVQQFFQEIESTGEIDQNKLKQLSNMLEERFQQANGLFENLFFTYNDKVIADGIGGESVGYKMDPNIEAYYYEQLENPGLATGDYMFSPITGRPTIPIINSILDNANRVISTLVIPLDVNNLTNTLITMSEDDTIGTMILDGQGFVIAADQEDLVLNMNFNGEETTKNLFTAMRENGAGTGKFSLNGEEYVAAYTKHDEQNLYLLSYMPVSQYMQNVKQMQLEIVNVIIVSVLITGVVVFFVIRRLVNPIKTIAQTAEQIANGDLTAKPLQIKSRDEVGELANAFNKMLESLKEMVTQVGFTSENVAATAEEFHSSAKQSTEISQQVAEAIHEVAAGTEEQSRNTNYSVEQINEITNAVKNVTQNTQSVTASANETAEKANAGAKIVHSSIGEIETVNTNMQEMAKKMNHLGERSKEIGQIVEVISEIADQTNLLALNASIEAARAGEHGRGFAVVADEVRKLAEESQASSEKITQLVNDILAETESTVHSMTETVDQSAKGIEAIKSVTQTFDDIQGSVNAVRAQIEEVAAANEQMHAAIEQIAANINQISQISSETAEQTQKVSSAMEEELASAEEIAAASQEMARLADELQALIQKFKVK